MVVTIGLIIANYVQAEDNVRIMRSDKKAQISLKLARVEKRSARI